VRVATESQVSVDERQKRHMRRSALLLGLLALGVYAAYLIFALTHGHA
jgi:hypothetical protein